MVVVVMIRNITNITDIVKLRYDIVRCYDLPEFNGVLKSFVMDELDGMIQGNTNPNYFIDMQHRINSSMDA